MDFRSAGAIDSQYDGLVRSFRGQAKQLESMKAIMASGADTADVSRNLLTVNRSVDNIQTEFNKIAKKMMVGVEATGALEGGVETVKLHVDESNMLYEVFCRHSDGSGDSAKQFSLFL